MRSASAVKKTDWTKEKKAYLVHGQQWREWYKQSVRRHAEKRCVFCKDRQLRSKYSIRLKGAKNLCINKPFIRRNRPKGIDHQYNIRRNYNLVVSIKLMKKFEITRVSWCVLLSERSTFTIKYSWNKCVKYIVPHFIGFYSIYWKFAK